MFRLRTRSAAPWACGSAPQNCPRRHTALLASLFLLLKGCTVAIFRRLLLAAGRARAVRASARAWLVRSNEYCRPAASRLPDGSTRLAMRAPAALAAAPAAAALAAAALAGERYGRRRPLHPRLPSRAPSRRARPTLLPHGVKLPKSVALFWAVSVTKSSLPRQPLLSIVTPEFSSDLEQAPGARSIADENSGVTFGVVELRRCEAYEHFRSHPVLLGTLPSGQGAKTGISASRVGTDGTGAGVQTV